jgi:hypothetical protein
MIHESTLESFFHGMIPDGATAPEWVQIPFGHIDYNRDGITGKQVLDAECANGICAWFASERKGNPRCAAGLPFYVGHPDYCPTPEQTAKWLREQPPAIGWVKELRPAVNSLDLRVEWTAEGRRLIESGTYKFFSPYFLAEKEGRDRYPVRRIKSCGLTNTPNWPLAPMVNSDTQTDGADEKEKQVMTLLERLLALLKDESITTDDQVVERVQALINSADEEKKKEEVETVNAATAKAKEGATRKAFATHVVNAAVGRGAILQEHSASRVEDMVNAADISAKAKEIDGLPPLMKTEASAADAAKRTASANTRREEIQSLVNAEMTKTGRSYDDCFAYVVKTKPELFK